MICPVRGHAPVAGPVRRRHTHRDGGQAVFTCVLQHEFLGLHPGADVRRQTPVDDDVVLGGDATAFASDGDVAAGEDEPVQPSVFRDLEHVACAVDVGVEQRGGVAQPATGVDHAVVHVLRAGHRVAQRLVVPDVADEPRDVKVIDADRVGTVAHHDAHVLTLVHQLAGDVRAEIPVGADDQSGHFCPPICPPNFAIHSAASSGSVPSSVALRHHLTAARTNRSGL